MIIQNAVVCNKCDDFIFSKHRHDFVECKCGNIFVDGGQDYLRRGGKALEDGSYSDLSWSIPDELYRACGDAAEEAYKTGRNKYGIANAVMRKLREAEYMRADGEHWITAAAPSLDEVWVCEPNGEYARYKKVVE